MFAQVLTDFQNQFFAGLNQFAEPMIRAGLGNPLLWPAGTIVIETIGRKTGRKIKLPVLATRIGDLVVFSTARRNSHWIRNLAANAEVRYWFFGQQRQATAFVLTPDQNNSFDELLPNAACLARALEPQSRLLGISFAILTPR